MDTQLSLSAKMIDRRTSTPRGNHSYGPFFLEYSLLAEFNLLQRQRMPGVYVIPSKGSPLSECLTLLKTTTWMGSSSTQHSMIHFSEWFGVLFLRGGPYQGGVFRFKLIIPENYPDGDCPVRKKNA